MKFNQLKTQLDEAVYRDRLYHATNFRGAINIAKDRHFRASGDPTVFDNEETGERVALPFISFARSRNSSYKPTGSKVLAFVVFEFDKDEILRQTRREQTSFEPYDFFGISDMSDRKVITTRKKYMSAFDPEYADGDADDDGVWRSARSEGDHELEERLWFGERDRGISKGVYRAVRNIHIVLGEMAGMYDWDEFDEDVEVLERYFPDRVNIFFYKDYRDWVMGKPTFDPAASFDQRVKEYYTS